MNGLSTRPQALVGVTMHRGAQRRLSEVFDWSPMPYDHDELMGVIGSIDAVIAYGPPFDEEIMSAAGRLKVIACHSCPADVLVGARRRGIAVTLVPSLWDTVADHTLALLFAAARNIPQAHMAIKSGQWRDSVNLKERFSGLDVFGKTLGILGLGQIGAALARRVQGFDMKVLYHDIERKPELEAQYSLEYASLVNVLARSDYLVVLVPLNDNTRGMLGREQFAMMKRGVVLVNTARGAILDEAALVEALRDGRVAAAGLDVFSEEPLQPFNPLLELENVVLTPHLGGSTKDCDLVLVEDAIRVLER